MSSSATCFVSKSNFQGLDVMDDEARQNLQMVTVKSNWWLLPVKWRQPWKPEKLPMETKQVFLDNVTWEL